MDESGYKYPQGYLHLWCRLCVTYTSPLFLTTVGWLGILVNFLSRFTPKPLNIIFWKWMFITKSIQAYFDLSPQTGCWSSLLSQKVLFLLISFFWISSHHNILVTFVCTKSWNNDPVKVSITNRKGKVRLHAARRLKVPEAEKIYRIYSDACLMSMSQGAGCHGAGCLWVKGVTAKVMTNLKVAFWRKSLFWPISTQRTSPSVIHRWKAMDPCYDM